MNIRLPNVQLEDPDEVKICLFPGDHTKWDPPEPLRSIQGPPPDSSVFIYWRYDDMEPKTARDMAFTYGLGQLDIGTGGNGALALAHPTACRRRRIST